MNSVSNSTGICWKSKLTSKQRNCVKFYNHVKQYHQVFLCSVCVKGKSVMSAPRFFAELRRFNTDESGSITAFTILSFLLMVVSAGMAVDFMRHETHRVELQDALDRGVLAAASITQTKPATETIRSYMKSANFVDQNYVLSVQEVNTPQVNPYYRKVSATASFDMRTFFLKIIGINTLAVVAKGGAEEKQLDIEISLVLDISTSMSIENTGGTSEKRIELLRRSASEFVDLVVNPSNAGHLTMSVVPFAGQVNPGPAARNYLRSSAVHNYSNCVDFGTYDFSDGTLPGPSSVNQMQYFQYSSDFYSSGDTFRDWGWCPIDAGEIVYHSDNATVLKNRVENLRTHEATGTQIGMKWGVALLDPTSRDMNNTLINAGDMSATFANRPVSYATARTMKTLVIMSDGNTTVQKRLNNSAYNSSSERAAWATNLPSSMSGGWGNFHTSTSSSTARQQFLDLCTDAKANGITIFTIGFDVADGSNAQTDMAACASSASHFYDVDGLELIDAFRSIAATIQKLKLVQ